MLVKRALKELNLEIVLPSVMSAATAKQASGSASISMLWTVLSAISLLFEPGQG